MFYFYCSDISKAFSLIDKELTPDQALHVYKQVLHAISILLQSRLVLFI